MDITETRRNALFSVTFITLILLSTQALIAASSEEAPGYAYVTSDPEYPLISRGVHIDGEYVRPRSLPMRVGAGSTICVSPSIYIDIDRRYVFRGWRDGLRDPCRTLTVNMTYTAIYYEQVLVQVFSELREYSRSFWVDVGETVNLTVPEVLERDGVQYRFIKWSGGEEPWSPTNHFTAVKPIRLELEWEPRYLLMLTSSHGVVVNGSGYYKHGSIAVISAPEEVLLEPGRKLVFDRWVSIGRIPAIIPNEKSSTTTVRVEAPYIIRAEYAYMYYVEALGLGGETVVKKWFKAGDTVQISVKPVIEVVQKEVRYVFKGWSDPSIPQIPSLTISVDKPLRIQAIYEKQYMVEAVGEYGVSGAGWYPENSTAILRAPRSPRAMLLLKTVFNGWAGDAGNSVDRGDTLIVRVDRPIRVVAVYGIEPDYTSIAVLGGIVTVLAAVGLRKTEKKKRVEVVKPEEISEKIAEY
jgi:hypothetical protein